MFFPFILSYTRPLPDAVTTKTLDIAIQAVEIVYSDMNVCEFTRENDTISFNKKFFSGYSRSMDFGSVDSGSIEFDVYTHSVTFKFSTVRALIYNAFLAAIWGYSWKSLNVALVVGFVLYVLSIIIATIRMPRLVKRVMDDMVFRIKRQDSQPKIEGFR